MYKNFRLWMIVLISSVILLGAWFTVDREYQEYLTTATAAREITTIRTAERISGFLSEPAYMLHNLNNDPNFIRIFNSPVKKQDLIDTLSALAKRDSSFQQLRWIDTSGMERVRLNQNHDKVLLIPEGDLQNKSGRYYFQETMALKPGELYISPLDLNIENKTIEIPYHPTVRIAQKIQNSSGTNMGIIIINRDASEVINLIDSASPGEQLFLTNQDGFWLRGFSRQEEWGFMFNRDDRLARKSPDAWQAINQEPSGDIHLEDGVWIWSTVFPLATRQLYQPRLSGQSVKYKVISYISSEHLNQIYLDKWKNYILPIATLIVLSGLTLSKLITLYNDKRAAQLKLNRSELLRAAESRALQAEIESRLLIESNVNGILTVNESGIIMLTNPTLESLFGYQKEELLGKPVEILIPEVFRKTHESLKKDYLSFPRHKIMAIGNRKVMGRCKNGNLIPVEVSLSPIPGAESPRVAATVVDISARVEAEKRLNLMAQVFDNTSDGILITDEQAHIIEVNKAFSKITGYHQDEIKGKNPRILQSERQAPEFYRDMWEAIKTNGTWRGEIWNKLQNGKIHPEWLTINRITDELGKVLHYVGVYTDISQIKQIRQELDHLAHHDPLSGLPNRLYLMETLEHAIQRCLRNKNMFALIYIDLDFFKHINDSFGHQVGDQLLIQVTKRLKKSIRAEDLLSRVGGDEFIILMEHISTENHAVNMAEKIISTYQKPFTIDQREIRISASIGLSLFPQDGESATSQLQHANAAMYRAKEAGRSSFQFYTEDMTYKAQERVQLENDLRAALEKDELYLEYQPQIDMQSGNMIGMEALLRWHHPNLGMISPARFIPLAEETGLIQPIGEWVLKNACQQGFKWHQQGKNYGRISVNVAGPQLKRGQLVETIVKILDETGLPENQLELEITESYIMEKTDLAITQLESIRKLGVTLSIDDFGTGYSSLAYLKALPIHKLKIDQSFIRDIPQDPDDIAITQTIIAMGNALKLDVIAEGVETPEQVKFLIEQGCYKAQGFYFSRPISALKLEQLYWNQKDNTLKLIANKQKSGKN